MTGTDTGTETGTDTGTETGSTTPPPVTPPPSANLAATIQTVRLYRGQTQVGYGSGFQPGESVTGEQHSTPLGLGTQVADANGQVRFEWTVRSNETIGNHAFIVTGAQSGSASVGFQVIARPAAGGGGGGTGALPTTGGSSGLTVAVAVGALLAGGALVALGSHRRMSKTR